MGAPLLYGTLLRIPQDLLGQLEHLVEPYPHTCYCCCDCCGHNFYYYPYYCYSHYCFCSYSCYYRCFVIHILIIIVAILILIVVAIPILIIALVLITLVVILSYSQYGDSRAGSTKDGHELPCRDCMLSLDKSCM